MLDNRKSNRSTRQYSDDNQETGAILGYLHINVESKNGEKKITEMRLYDNNDKHIKIFNHLEAGKEIKLSYKLHKAQTEEFEL